MIVWAVVNVAFFEWPTIYELHEHKTAAVARGYAEANGPHVNDGGFVACIPIETGADVLAELGKLHRDQSLWRKRIEQDDLIVFPWRVDK